MDSLQGRFRIQSFYQTFPPIDIIDVRTLTDLPTEIILCISDYLPLIDLICFSLCNHRSRAILQKTIGRSSLTQDDKLVFLARLERDLPAYFACNVCSVLHQFDGSESFGLSGTCNEQTCQLPCVQSGEWFSYPFVMNTHARFDHSLCRLSFLQIKLAMRRFHYGPSAGISTDSLHYTQVREYTKRCLVDAQSLWLFSTEATICPNPLGLYIRNQDIVIVKDWSDFFCLNDTFWDPIFAFWLCQHVRFYQYIAPLVASFLRREAVNWIKSSEGRCAICDVDYHVKAFEFDSRPTIIVTRWLNLGLGLTVDDPSWRLQSCLHWMINDELPNMKEGVSPRLCFEAMDCESLEDLTLRNLKYLRDENYKDKMQFSSWMDENDFRFRRPYHCLPVEASFISDAWYISYREPSKIKKILKKLLRPMDQRFSTTSVHESDPEKSDRILPRGRAKTRVNGDNYFLITPDHSLYETEAPTSCPCM